MKKTLLFVLALSSISAFAESECEREALRKIDALSKEAIAATAISNDYEATLKIKEIRKAANSCNDDKMHPACVGLINNSLGSVTYNDVKGFSYSGRLSAGAKVRLLNNVVNTWQYSGIQLIRVEVLEDNGYGSDQVGKLVSLQIDDTNLRRKCGLP